MVAETLTASLERLREALSGVRLPLDLPTAADVRDRCRRAVAQLDDYVLPRLARLDAPLLAVIGGSTGAGKSTLVNTLIGREVSAPGVIRPTTRSPVLVHHPADAAWFASDAILPGLARSTGTAHDPRTLQVVAEPSLPRGLAVLDAPDVDSVVAENRALAAQLLSAADLWLFVTTAARYADAVPWDYLRSAAERHAVVAVVLDRVPPAAMDEVPAHLGQMMGQRGLGRSPLFAVPETEVDADGLLPDAAVAPIRDWLAGLAADAVSRNEVVLQTLDGAIGALASDAPAVARAIEEQAAGLETLRTDAETTFAEAVRSIGVQTADGTLLRGEVLARWHDFVGTGEFFRAVEQKIGWLRDRVVAAVKGEPKQALEVKVAVESGLEVLIREEGEAAARRVESAWQAHPAGRQVLASGATDDLGRASREYPRAASKAIRDWQGDVLDLVASEGAAKKSTARFWALGVNGVGVALMILVFSQTGGLVGAELGVAGGTALLAQRVLEAIFGEDAVRRLAKKAKADLDARVEALLAVELSRYLSALDAVDVRPEQAGEVLAAAAVVDAARGELRSSGAPVPQARVLPAGSAAPVPEERVLPAGVAASVPEERGLPAGVPSSVPEEPARNEPASRRAGEPEDRAVEGEILDPEADS
ncbi:MAG: ABC transporter [Propionibacteriaceae bacterium]|nr:ABC transporter [Propionibacteriaceae bacterium]